MTDPALRLGHGMTARDLGDDALGRALDKLAQAGAAAVFSAVAARAYTLEGIRPTGMHFDTTSRSLYGAYPTADGTAGVAPRYGHSKDHRVDLKQIVFTGFVNRDGVPVMGTVEDGNRSDKRLNREQIDRIVAAFRPEALQDLVYIADSALVTGPNLDAVASAGIAWLSRLPDTFGVAATARRRPGSPWAAWPHGPRRRSTGRASRPAGLATGRIGSWSSGRRAWTTGRPRAWTGSSRRSGRTRSGRPRGASRRPGGGGVRPRSTR